MITKSDLIEPNIMSAIPALILLALFMFFGNYFGIVGFLFGIVFGLFAALIIYSLYYNELEKIQKRWNRR